MARQTQNVRMNQRIPLIFFFKFVGKQVGKVDYCAEIKNHIYHPKPDSIHLIKKESSINCQFINVSNVFSEIEINREISFEINCE